MNKYARRIALRAVSIASVLTRTSSGQRALANISKAADYLQGYRSGSSALHSGERVAFEGLPSRCTVFDVGANEGGFLTLALANVPDADIHCFEPSRRTFSILQRNARPSVTLNCMALGSAEGDAVLYGTAKDSGMASLVQRELQHEGITFEPLESVPVTTLTAYCQSRKVDRIDLLKIDVEGNELEVLRGGERLFGAGSIRRVLFEFGGTHVDSRVFFRDFLAFFQSHGAKRIARTVPGDRLVEVRRYSELVENFSCAMYVVDF